MVWGGGWGRLAFLESMRRNKRPCGLIDRFYAFTLCSVVTCQSVGCSRALACGRGGGGHRKGIVVCAMCCVRTQVCFAGCIPSMVSCSRAPALVSMSTAHVPSRERAWRAKLTTYHDIEKKGA